MKTLPKKTINETGVGRPYSKTQPYKKLTEKQFNAITKLIRLNHDGLSYKFAYEVFVNGKTPADARGAVPDINAQGAWNSISRFEKTLSDIELISQIEFPVHNFFDDFVGS